LALEVENPQVGDMLDLFCDGDLISKCLVVEKYRSYEYYGEEPTDKNQQFILTMHIIYKRKSGSPTCHKVGMNWPISQTIMETMIYTWKKAP
jgi:hypothetical protein